MFKRHVFVLFALLVFVLAGCSAARKPHCNLHVIDLMNKKNIYLPDTNANGLDNYLKRSSEWTRIPRKSNGKLDHNAAYKAARKGTVLATYNTGNNNSGHVVMVYGKKRWFGVTLLKLMFLMPMAACKAARQK
ncbi:hypothetical protein Dip510_000284 [Elusimicrobium posterum]|uniref:hypothetical protein n=1 Tax=Elusimicrobium posterum TaxID=3116653 RepID=UPI003C78A73A